MVPYFDQIQIDPHAQLDPSWRTKFWEVSSEYSEIITPRPGKYNGKYGRVDNSINFVDKPPP